MKSTDFERLQHGWGLETLNFRNLHYCLVRSGIANTIQSACKQWAKELPGGGTVLDVGCGLQPYRPWIEAAGLKYRGIERDGSATSGTSDVVSWDLTRTPWPFPDAEFDAILCTEVIEHVPRPDRVLSECARVCKAGSLMVLTAPFTWPEHEAPFDYYRFTQYGLRRLIEDADFSVEEMTARGGWATALGQMIGVWAVLGFAKPWSYVTRLLSYPVIRALDFFQSPSDVTTPHLLTLGYSVFARRRATEDAAANS
jgi:SAM-dependent methyltransferase